MASLACATHLAGRPLQAKRTPSTAVSAPRVVAPLRRLSVRAGVASPGDTVLIVGATGGVGQLTAAKLLQVRPPGRVGPWTCPVALVDKI